MRKTFTLNSRLTGRQTLPAPLACQVSGPPALPWWRKLLAMNLVTALAFTAIFASVGEILFQVVFGTITAGSYKEWTYTPFASYKTTTALHILCITCGISAAVLSWVGGAWRHLGITTWLVLLLYLMTACVWLAVGVFSMPFINFIETNNSPVVWLVVPCFIVGYHKDIGKYFNIIATTVSWGMILPMLYSIVKMRGYGRFESVNPHVIYLSLVLWFAAYHFLSSESKLLRVQLARAFPLIICCLVAVYNQGRGWLMQCFLVFGLFMIKPVLLGEKKAWSRLLLGGLVMLFGIGVAAAILVSLYPEAVNGLFERGLEDTRTAQYEEFFGQVSPGTIIVGGGPNATYQSNYGHAEAEMDYTYFDNQFIWMLFKGGVGITLGYVILVLIPAFRLFFRSRNHHEYAASAVLILWTLALLGLCTYHNVNWNAQNVFALILAGFCQYSLRSRVPVSAPKKVKKAYSVISQPIRAT